MSFDTTYRIFALLPERVATLFPQLWQDHAVAVRGVHTIAVFEDRPGSGTYYPASNGTNITPIQLSDGRVAYRAMWLLAITQPPLPDGVEELTLEQLQALTPTPTDE